MSSSFGKLLLSNDDYDVTFGGITESPIKSLLDELAGYGSSEDTTCLQPLKSDVVFSTLLGRYLFKIREHSSVALMQVQAIDKEEWKVKHLDSSGKYINWN